LLSAVRGQPKPIKIVGVRGIELGYSALKAVALTTTPQVGVRQIILAKEIVKFSLVVGGQRSTNTN